MEVHCSRRVTRFLDSPRKEAFVRYAWVGWCAAGYGGAERGRSVPADGKKGRVEDQTIRLASGRTVGFADYGIPDARAVLWCHGGPGRAAALAAATDAHGEDGSKMRGDIGAVLAPSDLALFGDPGWMKEAMAGFPAMFAYGLEGYTDDRLADGAGWVTFDVRSIRCPVTVLHGGDRMVDVIHAHHTAEVVPDAELAVFADHGHFSIVTEVVPAISNLLRR
jgi:hypothetical protein